jgi:hypothetical protein
MATVTINKLPTYILTSERLPGALGDVLLGRIVAKVQNPTDEYRPEDPRPALQSEYLEVMDTEFKSLFSAQENHTAKLRVGQLLGVDIEKLISDERQVDSPCVRTKFLPQHRDAMKALLGKHRGEIEQLMSDNDGKVYMVVGYKAAVEGRFKDARKYTSRKKIRIEVPTGAMVAAATHGTVNLGKAADIGAEAGSETTDSNAQSSQADGEQIFAIRYRELIGKKLGFFSSQKGLKVDYGDVPRVVYEDGVFHGEGDDLELVSEDEESGLEDINAAGKDQTPNKSCQWDVDLGDEVTSMYQAQGSSNTLHSEIEE